MVTRWCLKNKKRQDNTRLHSEHKAQEVDLTTRLTEKETTERTRLQAEVKRLTREVTTLEEKSQVDKESVQRQFNQFKTTFEQESSEFRSLQEKLEFDLDNQKQMNTELATINKLFKEKLEISANLHQTQ